MSEQDRVSENADQVKQLVDLLKYQEGSIVSRVLLKNKGGTVTLFESENCPLPQSKLCHAGHVEDWGVTYIINVMIRDSARWKTEVETVSA